jgi:hypothetical protein
VPQKRVVFFKKKKKERKKERKDLLSVIQQVIIGHLLCAKPCNRCWSHASYEQQSSSMPLLLIKLY